jgi:O-antigen ligase
VRAAAASILVAALIAGLALDQAGFFPRSWVWGAVVFLWLAALALVLRERVSVTRLQVLWLGAICALAVWVALTTAWSSSRRLSILDARRDLVYIGCAAAVVFLWSRGSAALFARAFLAATTLVLLASLAHYLLVPSSRHIVPFEGALLSWPLGYANGVAALGAMATPIALASAAHDRPRAARIASACTLSPLVAALVFSESTGGAIAAAGGAAALVALDPRRRAVLVTMALALPAVAVVAITADRSRLTDLSLTSSELRHGRWLAFAGLCVGAVLGTLAARAPRVARGRAPSRRWTLVAVGVALVVAGVVASLPRLGGDSTLTSLVGTERAGYWDVAWTQIGDGPALGTGAGTFAKVWLERGDPQLGGALDAHNLYLETFAEIGLVGLLLLVFALIIPVSAAPAAAERARLGAAASAAYVAFLVHVFVDWDWELPAVTAGAVALAGAVLALSQRAREGRELHRLERIALTVAAVVLAALALVGLASNAAPGATAAPSSGDRTRVGGGGPSAAAG